MPPPADKHRAVVGNPVDMEDVLLEIELLEIETDRVNLGHARFLSFVAPQMTTTLWHIDAGEEGRLPP
jgi:hypothetical protein